MQRGGYEDTGGLNNSLKTVYITYLKDLAPLIKAFHIKFTKISRFTGLRENALSRSMFSMGFLVKFSKINAPICSFLMMVLLTVNVKVSQNSVSTELGQPISCEIMATCMEWRDRGIPAQCVVLKHHPWIHYSNSHLSKDGSGVWENALKEVLCAGW